MNKRETTVQAAIEELKGVFNAPGDSEQDGRFSISSVDRKTAVTKLTEYFAQNVLTDGECAIIHGTCPTVFRLTPIEL